MRYQLACLLGLLLIQPAKAPADEGSTVLPKHSLSPYFHVARMLHAESAVSLGTVAEIHAASGGGAEAGEERVDLTFETKEVLHGSMPSKPQFTFSRPSSPVARMKMPEPIWGGIELVKGARLLLVTDKNMVVFASEVSDLHDPVLLSLRELFALVRNAAPGPAWVKKRMKLLKSPSVPMRLFAGDTLSEEGPANQAAIAIADAFAGEKDEYVSMSAIDWLWSNLFQKADKSGKLAVTQATLSRLRSSSSLVTSSCLDKLLEVPLDVAGNSAIRVTPEARAMIRKRVSQETDTTVRKRVEAVAKALLNPRS